MLVFGGGAMFSFVNIPQDLPCLWKLHDFPTKKSTFIFATCLFSKKALAKRPQRIVIGIMPYWRVHLKKLAPFK